MKFSDFTYCAPATVADCLEVLGADGATLLAGGQSLLPLMALRLVEPAVLVDVSGIGDLREMVVEPDGAAVWIGAAVTQAELEDRAGLARLNPVLAQALPLIGHRAIRNRGTVGGSIAHADPAAEWPALCVTLDADIELRGPGGARSVPAREFFEGPFMTACRDGEVLTRVRLPSLRAGQGGALREVARRHGDFATVGCAAVLTAGEDGTLARAAVTVFGGVSRPERLDGLERALPAAAERDWPDLVREAVEGVAFHDDIHASAGLRRHLATHLLGDALRQAREAAR